jgi:hypothetical protein
MLNASITTNSLSSTTDRLASREVGLFNQVAMFSASGLVVSMAFIVIGGFQIAYPWF